MTVPSRVHCDESQLFPLGTLITARYDDRAAVRDRPLSLTGHARLGLPPGSHLDGVCLEVSLDSLDTPPRKTRRVCCIFYSTTVVLCRPRSSRDLAMSTRLVPGIYVVAAVKGPNVEYWAAATPRGVALSAVQQFLAPGWKATGITNRRVTSEQVSALALRPGGVRMVLCRPRSSWDLAISTRLVPGIYVVAAVKGTNVEYWAAATPRGVALSAVQQFLAPGWKATGITNRRVTSEQVSALELRPGGVRKLTYEGPKRAIDAHREQVFGDSKRPSSLQS